MATGQDIVNEARTWLGTPFHHQGRAKGAGVDCVGLPGMSAQSVGFKVEDRTGYSRLPDGETLEAELDRQMLCVWQRGMGDPLAVLQPGDVPLFRMPRLPRHVGIYCGVVDGEHRFIHATSDVGKVVEINLDAYWRRALKKVYRFKEVAADLIDSGEGA